MFSHPHHGKMKPRSVISGVVADRYDAATRLDTGPSKYLHELPEGL
jgi:hypothetical protein